MPKAATASTPEAPAAAPGAPAVQPGAPPVANPPATPSDPAEASADDSLLGIRCERLAAVLVAAGRVVPALEVDGEGQLCARWWPLPAAEDRPWLEALLASEEPAVQRQLAARLAAAVDRLARQRLQGPPHG